MVFGAHPEIESLAEAWKLPTASAEPASERVCASCVGGGDDLASRTTLCAYHQLRCVHTGRVHVTGSAPDGLRFELGLRPGQPPLLRYRSAERLELWPVRTLHG